MLDINSLYPYCNKHRKYVIGHPDVYYRHDIPDEVNGLLKAKILPPDNLYMPVLPYRVNKKLMFVLCRTCAEECNQNNCTHTDEERALIGTWVTLEVEKAVSLGYVILEKYCAWDYKEMSSPDVEGGLWGDYIDVWLKLKQESSGYPDWATTDDLKQMYVDDYEQHEGVRLDPSKIERNEGLRALSKLMLNSHWGKFGYSILSYLLK